MWARARIALAVLNLAAECGALALLASRRHKLVAFDGESAWLAATAITCTFCHSRDGCVCAGRPVHGATQNGLSGYAPVRFCPSAVEK